jgi:hypothetical protein
VKIDRCLYSFQDGSFETPALQNSEPDCPGEAEVADPADFPADPLTTPTSRPRPERSAQTTDLELLVSFLEQTMARSRWSFCD